MLKCKDCSKYLKTHDVDYGVCSLVNNYFPTEANNDCVFLKIKPITCKDCSRFENDTACFTAKEDDDASKCSGFIDKREDEFYNILFNWAIEGIDVKSKFEEVLKEIEKDKVYLFIKEHKGKE